ncbi:Wzz/FepE/Etk N-terminal domain-containing protein [Actinophytocola sp.]|uniref:Wzz/FepE/Etk N-terminal domain-containing protein n=1 Tax=Actinophytocola sp. TaxID=1872138 RepID=UPI002ED5AA41
MTGKPDAPQHLLDFARLWVAIRRGRRVWLAFAMLGLLGGGALTVLMPPAPTAVTRILVVHEQDGPSDGGMLIRTDVALMTTTRIAAQALDKLGLAQQEQPEEFLKQYEVVGLTNNILELSVEGPTGAEAARRAKALAEVFIADHIGRIKSAAAAEAKAFIDQRGQVQAELDQVNVEISGAEAAAAQENEDEAPPSNAATLDTLYARRAELTNQITQLTQQAQEAGIGAPRVEAGTQIVDAPRAVKVSLTFTGATNAGIGFVLGLVLGVTLAAVTGVVRDKPVLRKDIAEHLGASVIAEVRRRRFLPSKKAERERKRVAATLVRLVRDGSGPVSVLELGAAPLARTLATDVATELAGDRAVVLVAEDAERFKAVPDGVRVIGADDTSPARSGEARIGVGSVAPGAAWTDLPHLGGETLLVVKAGHVNTTWLHTVASQLADAGIPVVGVVLADPDPRDKSDGTLWDGLHTALRGRAKHKNTLNDMSTNVHDLPTKRFSPVRSGKKEG